MKYSSAEVNYAYRSAYLTFCNQYGSYLSYVGLDTSKALDEQECRISDDFDTWDDYFKDAAEKNLVQVTALCDAAQKAGVTLDEDDQHEIDEQFSYLELTAKQYKYNSVQQVSAGGLWQRRDQKGRAPYARAQRARHEVLAAAV